MAEQKRTTEKTRRPKWQAAFFETLAKTGNVGASCRLARVGRTTVYHYRNTVPAFAKAWEEAMDVSCDLLEEEARRRAYEGLERKKFNRSGKPIKDPATRRQYVEREYSDTLLIFLLKAHRPDKYRENFRHELSGPGGASIPITFIEISGPGSDAKQSEGGEV